MARRGLCLSSLGLVALALGCGSRSGLLPGAPDEIGDAGIDAAHDAVADAPIDAPPDAPPECQPNATYVYVVTSERELLAFKPESGSFESRGFLACKDPSPAFSMAVSRTGTAYVELQNGRLEAVSVFDAACKNTPWKPPPDGQPFHLFGSGFARDNFGIERLYATDITFTAPSVGLGSIDDKTFALKFVGPFSELPGFTAELTNGPKGDLWAYFLPQTAGPGTLARVDTETAAVLEKHPVSAGNSTSSLGVAWWGDSFYIFTGDNGSTSVTRYVLATGTTSVVTSLNAEVVGAAVSTCAEVPNP